MRKGLGRKREKQRKMENYFLGSFNKGSKAIGREMPTKSVKKKTMLKEDMFFVWSFALVPQSDPDNILFCISF